VERKEKGKEERRMRVEMKTYCLNSILIISAATEST
jgi:phage anti-repressor protein